MRTKFIFVCTLVVILVIQAEFSTGKNRFVSKEYSRSLRLGYPIKSNHLRALLENKLMKVTDCIPYESNKRILPLRFRRSNDIRKTFACLITLK